MAACIIVIISCHGVVCSFTETNMLASTKMSSNIYVGLGIYGPWHPQKALSNMNGDSMYMYVDHSALYSLF